MEAADIDLPWASIAGFADLLGLMALVIWLAYRHQHRRPPVTIANERAGSADPLSWPVPLWASVRGPDLHLAVSAHGSARGLLRRCRRLGASAPYEVATEHGQPEHRRVGDPPLDAAFAELGDRPHSRKKLPRTVDARVIVPSTIEICRSGDGTTL